jgi:hypothetical protein
MFWTFKFSFGVDNLSFLATFSSIGRIVCSHLITLYLSQSLHHVSCSTFQVRPKVGEPGGLRLKHIRLQTTGQQFRLQFFSTNKTLRHFLCPVPVVEFEPLTSGLIVVLYHCATEGTTYSKSIVVP